MNSRQVQSFFLDSFEETRHPFHPERDFTSLSIEAGQHLLVSVDTLISGVHFPEHTPPEWIAHKALAVNLSDIAAMGGKPVAYTLNITHPSWESSWLQSFRSGLFSLAKRYHVSLLSCVAETGPLSITIQIFGFVPPGMALLRSTAKAGDKIVISNCTGDAAAGLAISANKITCDKASKDYLESRLNLPEPRVALGLLLKGIASSAIDISDGFLADLGHILKESGKGAIVYIEDIPLSSSLLSCFDRERCLEFALSGGDDYELCFTVPADRTGRLADISESCNLGLTCVGEITEGHGLLLKDESGRLHTPISTGYDHFRK
jgi:thiamine-monophosphate kinase